MLSNLLFFICILTSSFIFTAYSYNNKCLRHQEILLLQLRDEMFFNSSLSTKLVRWNESGECCKWNGVECDASGYVVTLQLDDEGISGGIGDSSSLFRFKYLQKLNLAHNDFYHTRQAIPKGIGYLTYLTHLNLSDSGFGGQVPFEISFLKRLVSLDISNGYTLSLEHPNLEMLIQNLTELRELYLDWVNITSFHERKNWAHVISSHLPHLTTLSLVGCGLYGPLPKSFWQLHSLSILRLDGTDLSVVSLHDLFTNFPSLTTLSLNRCSLKGSIPSSLANLTKLIYVDLSRNSLTGSLPSTLFEGFSNLVHLDLRHNSFFGNIPHSLFALPSLLELDLSSNQLNGTLQLDNFRSLPNLTFLSLSGNSLLVDAGNINSSSYGGLQLKVLGLASCNLSDFPHFIKHMDLEELSLSKNSIAGEIPSWIWGTRLVRLNLSFNLLTDLQKPYYIPSSLRYISFQTNQLKDELHLPIPLESQLRYLFLDNNSLSGSIPTSICNATQLVEFDLSRNKFSGSIPKCLCNATQLDFLSLSGNRLSGSIPSSLLINIREIDLSRNNISGNIPLFPLERIRALDLSQNIINGSIPDIFPMDCWLEYLNLNNNSLEGKIPKSLKSCKLLRYIDVGNNMMNDTFPCMLSLTLRVLVLRSNRFHGDLRCYSSWPKLHFLDVSRNHFSGSLQSINFSNWTAMMRPTDEKLRGGRYYGLRSFRKMVELYEALADLSTIDLSSNSFYGELPNAIGDLTSLHILNFSHNALNGSIPKSFGQLKNLESLDLSVNQLAWPSPEELMDDLHLPISLESNLVLLYMADNNLSGLIPTCLCNVTQLVSLDLSRNKLSGSIPACLLTNIREIDLSRNNISGSIPYIFPVDCNLQYLDLNNNALEGKIPKSLEHCTLLVYMNVGNNMMNDSFPCMPTTSRLIGLVLHSNRFNGDLRCQSSWPLLQILDVSSNYFSGSLDSINFSSWTAMVLRSDGNLGVDFGHRLDVALIIKGQLLEYQNIRLDFSIIDLSSNSFYGNIPNAIGDLTSLHQLNFSHNALTGSIPKSFGRLGNLESQDLSVNQLAGSIPEELGGLTFLSVLNLSYNKFVGAIPKGRQIQTFSADSFQGNPGLHGFPLDLNGSNATPPTGNGENGEEKTEIEWEYVCAAVGYVVGVGSIAWLLLFCRSFREKYFGKIEEVVEDMFIARDMRRRRTRRAAAARNRVRRQ